MQTALAQGMGHLIEGSDSFSCLLSHVAKHMLALQGEEPWTAYSLWHPACAAAKSWLLPSPPCTSASVQMLHHCGWGLSSPNLAREATSQCNSWPVWKSSESVQGGGLSDAPGHLPSLSRIVQVTKIVVLMSQDSCTFLEMTKDPKDFTLCWLYLSVLITSEIKTESEKYLLMHWKITIDCLHVNIYSTHLFFMRNNCIFQSKEQMWWEKCLCFTFLQISVMSGLIEDSGFSYLLP